MVSRVRGVRACLASLRNPRLSICTGGCSGSTCAFIRCLGHVCHGWLGFGSCQEGNTCLLLDVLWHFCVRADSRTRPCRHGSDSWIAWGAHHSVQLRGLAIGSNDLRQRWQKILVSFAGPLAQFGILAVVVLGGASSAHPLVQTVPNAGRSPIEAATTCSCGSTSFGRF